MNLPRPPRPRGAPEPEPDWVWTGIMKGRIALISHVPGKSRSRSPYWYSPSMAWLRRQFELRLMELLDRLSREENREPEMRDAKIAAPVAWGMAKLEWVELEERARRN